MKTKSFKDTVHGYIQVEEPYWRIIDTAEFQRLKWIEQTSYRVLYPSARHDRFIHSIGTYHLGQMAFQGFLNNCQSLGLESQCIQKYRTSFLSACLLHDIGHAPFSHTCEDLYNYRHNVSNIDSKLNVELLELINACFDDNEAKFFHKDYRHILVSSDGICKAPSEHEVMSAIIVLKNKALFWEGFQNSSGEKPMLDLLIRSILGCAYGVNRGEVNEAIREKGIKNCLIRLLNSSTVDVDKLDYIARDTLMSGYDSIILDNARLLNSLSYVIKEGIYYPAFNKGALSVISNVIEAKNAQAKWIVNHPIVIYEFYLLRKSIGISLRELYINSFSNNSNNITFDDFLSDVFSSKSISKEPNRLGSLELVLLSDMDLLCFMKKFIDISDVREYFERDQRKSPIWKSHEEYKYCLRKEENTIIVADFFRPLVVYFNQIEELSHPRLIDEAFYQEISTQDLVGKEAIVNILDALKDYCVKHQKEFNFVILSSKGKFSTDINGERTYIRFGVEEDDFIDLQSLLGERKRNTHKNYDFFYLYSKSKIEVKSFLEDMLKNAKNKQATYV